MHTARTAPIAAVLADGRVLVAGGTYKDSDPWQYTGSTGMSAAAIRPESPADGTGGAKLDDVAPPDEGAALATAEIFDPATGRWTPAGPMRFARAGAAAATLSDGRVLVVGPSAPDPGLGHISIDQRAFDTAEVYDPTTGRFTPVGSLPPIDWGPIEKLGIGSWGDWGPDYSSMGTLVPLPGGDALLVGQSVDQKHGTFVSRTFRFHGSMGSWSQVGPSWAYGMGGGMTRGPTRGIDLASAIAAPLPDGRVLVAGGRTRNWEATDIARLYDPTTGAWVDLPRMPVPREDGLATVLSDGSVLVVGGRGGAWASAPPVRFAPAD